MSLGIRPSKASFRTLLGLAWRESRTARRRLLLYMSSISLGVAALVAIDSFASNLTRSVQEQSRALLGGDVSVGSRTAFTPAADSILDSLARSGVEVARVATFLSIPWSRFVGRWTKCGRSCSSPRQYRRSQLSGKAVRTSSCLHLPRRDSASVKT